MVSRGSLCGSFKIVAVSTQRFRSLHNKASKRMLNAAGVRYYQYQPSGRKIVLEV